MHLVRIKFLSCLLGMLVCWNSYGKPPEQHALHRADSLFTIGQYRLAQELYRAHFNSQPASNPNLLLKMAFIAERNGAYTHALYYLSCLAEMEPSVMLYSKMEAIAEQHGLSGYAFNDFNYLMLFFRSYGDWLYLFLLALMTYVLYEVVRKYRLKERIRTRHKLVIIAYLAGLLVAFNIGSSYQEGIVAGNPAFVREKPSSASAVAGTIAPGNKVVILKATDHWKMVWWDQKLVYLRSHDLMII